MGLTLLKYQNYKNKYSQYVIRGPTGKKKSRIIKNKCKKVFSSKN
jgi:hypothetical protein